MTTTSTISRGPAVTAAVAGPLFLVASFASPPDGPDVATATSAQIRAWAVGQDSALHVGARWIGWAGVAGRRQAVSSAGRV
ncbi:hypothetical protein GCM10009557_70250 [Virgisporangium ochraceum]|uniref:Uncharacterized protein n=1 Tax=Virgisporangium ochraceum TaxID=65505 RepID=A0A8J4EFB9_9ACTN|nr:hypothetical protein [Virgisporangium ochraceum]GIJ73525.1 hypothetical protein Voc01_084420 [Virgisporangium ochraceum]